MRKLKTRPSHGFAFRLFWVGAGALLLMAAFAPCANADCPACIRYYNFEGPADPTYGVGLQSRAPAFEVGGGVFALQLHGTAGIPYPVQNTSVETPGLPQNRAVGDLDTNNRALGIHRSSTTQLNLDMTFVSPTGVYDITSVSFAVEANGNGYLAARVQVGTDGVNFTTIGPAQVIPTATGTVLTFNLPSGTTANIPVLFLRINFTGGRSNGVDLQNEIDNIQINGTIIPEPATVAGGLLGVLGLCWFQRRRLIRSVRLRRT